MNVLVSTKRMQDIERKFQSELVHRAEKVRAVKPPVVLPPRSEICRGRSTVSVSAGK